MDDVKQWTNNHFKVDKEEDISTSSAIQNKENVNRSHKGNDENLLTLKKVHSILLNCVNLTKKQKLEFAESERYFMKLYLKNLRKKLEG